MLRSGHTTPGVSWISRPLHTRATLKHFSFLLSSKTTNELHFARVDVKAAEERVQEVKGQLAALTKVGWGVGGPSMRMACQAAGVLGPSLNPCFNEVHRSVA